ncbi:MAG: Fe-S cluster assembly protein SufD [Alphaproteobacteria bacterium]
MAGSTLHQRGRLADPDFLSAFAAQADLPTFAPWQADLRQVARRAVADQGLPSVKREAWKYTNLQSLAGHPFVLAGDGADLPASVSRRIDQATAGEPPLARLVFANGRLVESLSDRGALPAGVVFTELAAADEAWLATRLGRVAPADSGPVQAMATAWMASGAALRIADGVSVERPLHVVHLCGGTPDTPTAAFPRMVVELGAASRAELVETYLSLSDGVAWSSPVSEIVIGRDATLRHRRVQRLAEQAFHLAVVAAEVGQGGHYESFLATLGGGVSRDDCLVRLLAEAAGTALAGMTFLSGRQHGEASVVVRHEAPHTRSTEHFRAALADRARGVFQGRIHVARGASGADGQMLSRALLLSPTAEMDTKPELEIFTDDVACSHGAVTGQLDPEQMYYLLARAIPKAEARALLVEGFLAEALTVVTDTAARDGLLALARQRLYGEVAQ